MRVNDITTHWAYGDIIEVVTGAGNNLDTIIVPKVTAARDVWWVDVLLTQLGPISISSDRSGSKCSSRTSPGGARRAIATASPRLDAIIFGAGDLSVSQGARVDTNFVRAIRIRETSGTTHG